MSTISTSFDSSRKELTISVSGPFNFDDISAFRAAYSGVEPSPASVVVDMREVASIDSAVLGVLLNMQQNLALSRETTRIVNAPADVRRIFDITHFDKKFIIE